MDRVGARNAFVVLLTVVALTVASVGVLLYLVVEHPGVEPPVLLVGLVTTLIGFLTGTQVNLDAKPKVGAAVDQVRSIASDIGYEVREAAAIPTVAPLTADLSPPASTYAVSLGFSEDDLGGPGPASGANDHPEP